MPAYRCSRIGARVGPGEFRGLGVAGGGCLHRDGAKAAVRFIIVATAAFFNRGLAHPRRAPGILDLYGWPPGGSGSLKTCPRCCRGRLPGGRRCCGTSALLIKCWPSFRRRTIASPVRPGRLSRAGPSAFAAVGLRRRPVGDEQSRQNQPPPHAPLSIPDGQVWSSPPILGRFQGTDRGSLRGRRDPALSILHRVPLKSR